MPLWHIAAGLCTTILLPLTQGIVTMLAVTLMCSPIGSGKKQLGGGCPGLLGGIQLALAVAFVVVVFGLVQLWIGKLGRVRVCCESNEMLLHVCLQIVDMGLSIVCCISSSSTSQFGLVAGALGQMSL